MPDPYSTFGLTCPSGGSFYICQNNTTEFIGCCTINPCRDGSGSCPHPYLRNASFSADSYEGLKPQDCAEETGQWYTCKYNKPPFLGCCASNPCASMACPAGDLVPAKLSGASDLRDVFLTIVANATASHSSTGTGIPSGSSGAVLSTVTIVGITVSVVIVVLVLIGGCVFVFKRGWHAGKRQERGSATRFLDSPPSGRFMSPVLSPPFTPYRDSQAYATHGNTIGLASPPLFSAQSPAPSNYPFIAYYGSTAGDPLVPALAGHVRHPSSMSELGTQAPRIQELETDHNSQEFARHELAAESGSPTPPSRGPNRHEELPRSTLRTLTSRQPVRSDTSARRLSRTPAARTRQSSMNKALPRAPPRTPPPVVVSPETSPILVSRFSASRRNALKGLNILDGPTALFGESSPAGRESAFLLSPETPGRPSGSSVYSDFKYVQR